MPTYPREMMSPAIGDKKFPEAKNLTFCSKTYDHEFPYQLVTFSYMLTPPICHFSWGTFLHITVPNKSTYLKREVSYQITCQTVRGIMFW